MCRIDGQQRHRGVASRKGVGRESLKAAFELLHQPVAPTMARNTQPAGKDAVGLIETSKNVFRRDAALDEVGGDDALGKLLADAEKIDIEPGRDHPQLIRAEQERLGTGLLEGAAHLADCRGKFMARRFARKVAPQQRCQALAPLDGMLAQH